MPQSLVGVLTIRRIWQILGTSVAGFFRLRRGYYVAGGAARAGAEEYLAIRKRHMAETLAARLGAMTRIERCGVRFDAVYDPLLDAVWVSNLGASPYLPTEVFVVASELLSTTGSAPLGNAMRGRLGDPELPLDSIEGAVAAKVFERREGEAVYRRIAAIAGLMVHLRLAEIDSRRGRLESPGIGVFAA